MSKIIDIYLKSNKPVFSFEFFPPKTVEGEEKLFLTIENLSQLNPSFVSVTYGAGGTTRTKTVEISRKIQDDFKIETMCHFTCVGVDSNQIKETLDSIHNFGIKNLMALRGDPPKGEGKFTKTKGGFENATELISFIKSEGYSFCLGGGCYPEKHPDAPTLEIDIQNLKHKVDAGADFLITQLFFKNSVFFDFLENTKKTGINKPIIPGIMPITNFNQIARFKEMAGCEIPESLVTELEALKDDPIEFQKKSLAYTTGQCKELLQNGVFGIHFYTLNQSRATFEIMKKLI
ncbi:MAG: methylenetetrahydrofolate reductase [NAD(P)H] [Leptospiraceae bacterium]|nr:methylenetetrahydrofolate reductase [NAD(P)H] [Leptospiraceae bacterium]MCP5496734.1 methylenetetrahydrofolate reductase [NAD(P)H] [Leptospiraceae bacterium]